MPICVTALCGRVSVQAQAGSAPAAIIPKEAVPIDPKQERHISMQSAKSPETAATSARKKNGKKKKNKPRRSIFGTIMRFIGCLLCVCVMAASAGAVLLSLYVVQVTEDPDGKLDLDEQKLKQTSIVYDRDGNEVNTFAGENNRIWREISAMPEDLQNAVIAVEDKDFRSEPGINVKRTIAAALNEFTGNALLGSKQGASTLEQQLVKNLTGDSEQDILRKVREIFRALGLCNRYSKETILEAYLNTIPLTGTIYGMEAGAQEYFGKSVEELSLAECAELASITKNPKSFNPATNPENLLKRRNHVLALMRNQGYITDEECAAAQAEPITLAESKSATEKVTRTSRNSYFDDALFADVTQAIMEQESCTRAEAQDKIFSDGLRIYSTLDQKAQSAMEQVMLNEDTVVTHRVVGIVPDEEDPTVIRFRTKGDANEAEDSGLVHYKNVIGTPIFSIPYLGYVAEYIQHPPGMYIAISAGAILLLLVFIPDIFADDKDKEQDKKKKSSRRNKGAHVAAHEAAAVDAATEEPASESLADEIRRKTDNLLTDEEIEDIRREVEAGRFDDAAADALRRSVHLLPAAELCAFDGGRAVQWSGDVQCGIRRLAAGCGGSQPEPAGWQRL